MCWQVQASISYFPKITSNTLLGSTFMDYSFLNFPLSLYADYCLYFPNDFKFLSCLMLSVWPWSDVVGVLATSQNFYFIFFIKQKN